MGPTNTGITFCATLVDQWVRLGVRHAVVSPGSRSTPLAVACAEHPDLTTHVHHDERSASFTALGIGLATRIPALLVTTSGTAVAELHAAVVEAHQAFVPMLVCTADRPPELQGVGAPQTIHQTRIFGDAVRWFVEPGPPTDEYAGSWRHLATDAFFAASGAPMGAPPGPVHLNLAFREPLVGPCGELPDPIEVVARPVTTWGVIDEQLGELIRAVRGRRGVIVAGDRATRTGDEREAVLELADALGWPILSDHLSGLRVEDPSVVIGADALVRVADLAETLRPEFVLRFGGLLSSRLVNEWLSASGAPQVGVDRWGAIPDPDGVLAQKFPADIATVCRQLLDADDIDGPAEWLPRWRRLSRAATAAIEATASGEIASVRQVWAAVPPGGSLVVSSSMPVRDLEWYGGNRGDVTVFANRGANGIDGVTSTAVGVALGTGAPTVCLIGDVAFLHDTNALLGLAARGAAVCIVVIDNDGGGIFSFLPQASVLSPDRFEQLFGTPHGVDISLLAAAHGVDVATAPDAEVLGEILERWISHPRPLVVHVPSDRAANVAAHRVVNEAVAVAAPAALAEG